MEKYESTEAPVQQGNSNFALTIIFAATCVIIGGMIADQQRVALAVICGIAFFSFLVVMFTLVQTGQLVAAYRVYQREKTLRAEHRWQYEAYLREQQVTVVNEQISLPSEQTSLPATNFVTANPRADEGLKIAAYAWVTPLFKGDKLDPERVLPDSSRSPDKVQMRKPAPEVLEYLRGLEILRGGEKGATLFFNQSNYNSLRKCRQAIKYGIPFKGASNE